MRLWLASGSPRRRTLLTWCGWEVDVHPPDVDESRDPSHDPVAHAEHLARKKAKTIPNDRLGLAADTVVHLDGRVFDKPRDRAEAAAHLRALSGRWHQVTTGVALQIAGEVESFTTTTEVRFRDLTESDIAQYLATGEADDKAGAYGIQGRAAVFVAEVRGSWTNVVGLPVEAVLPRLEAAQ